ncbi:CFI-box-CTERM domain-containing protein [Microbacterium sp.]|uniref:CFI-box-CTERM domain-containing protein n=1 Tax=Microbacterium sp. TaxID=51671 RepID=UPI003A9523FB
MATAVYGSYDAAEVLVLRKFRDERLNSTAPGRLLVRIYYSLSPRIAGAFRERRVVNRTAKHILDRIVGGLRVRHQAQEHERRSRT